MEFSRRFLSELLFQDISILEVIDSEGKKETKDDKFNRVDIIVKTFKDEIMIIELQMDSEWDFLSRLQYGVAKTITEHMKEGDPYHKIKKVYSIRIVHFDIGHGTDYIYHGIVEFKGIHNNDVLGLSDIQKKMYMKDKIDNIFSEYYLIKVNNFDDVAKNTLDEWVYFLKNAEVKDSFTAKGMDEVREKLVEMNLPPEERMAYIRYKEDLHYQASMLDSSYGLGRHEGEAIGLERGEAIGFEKALKKLMNTGMSEIEARKILE